MQQREKGVGQITHRPFVIRNQRLVACPQTGQPGQVEPTRDQPQDGGRVILRVIDEVPARERRNDDGRNSGARTQQVPVGRRHVIPGTSEFVVGNDECCTRVV